MAWDAKVLEVVAMGTVGEAMVAEETAVAVGATATEVEATAGVVEAMAAVAEATAAVAVGARGTAHTIWGRIGGVQRLCHRHTSMYRTRTRPSPCTSSR